jgi:hypothetical protein
MNIIVSIKTFDSTSPLLEVFKTCKKSHNTKVGPHKKFLHTARWLITWHVVGRTVRDLGADGLRVFDIYLISEVFGKGFREKFASRRTNRGS